MKPYFIGRLNWAPQDPAKPDLWQLEEYYGLAYDHYLLVCAPHKQTDGASIPGFLRCLLGEPFENENKFWAPFHDYDYHDNLIIVDLHTTMHDAETAFIMIADGNKSIESRYIAPHSLGRKWADKMCRDGAMVAAHEHRWKRRVVYAGIRAGGWRSWDKWE